MARCTPAQSALTRSRLLEAAISEFAQEGVLASTLAGIASRARLTRGAVYWHFADKADLIDVVFSHLRWPLDVGCELNAYRLHPHPLHLLREQLLSRVNDCMDDPLQWQVLQLALHHGNGELPAPTLRYLEKLQATAVSRLGWVLEIVKMRSFVSQQVVPAAAAQCLHAAGVGVLFQHAGEMERGNGAALILALDLLMAGLAAQQQAAGEPSQLKPCLNDGAGPFYS